MSKHDGDGNRTPRLGHPNTVDEIECLDSLGEHLRNDQRYFSFGGALVVSEFDKPCIIPVLGSLGFP
jgi:hypothetical protein